MSVNFKSVCTLKFRKNVDIRTFIDSMAYLDPVVEHNICVMYAFDYNNCNKSHILPMQPLGPPLKAKKLNLWRLATFSESKLSGLKDHGFGYSSGRWCVHTGDITHVVPFGNV